MKNSRSVILDNLIRLAPHTEIAHHIPGRVRIKILPSGFGIALDMDVDDMIQCIPGIIRIRINLAARSLVIDYDKDRLPYDLWEKLKHLKGRPELEKEIKTRLHNMFA